MSPSRNRLHRVLKTRDVLTLAFGAIIGWSWVLMTGHWILEGGSLGTLVAFAVGGFAIILIGLTYAELAAALPWVGVLLAYLVLVTYVPAISLWLPNLLYGG